MIQAVVNKNILYRVYRQCYLYKISWLDWEQTCLIMIFRSSLPGIDVRLMQYIELPIWKPWHRIFNCCKILDSGLRRNDGYVILCDFAEVLFRHNCFRNVYRDMDKAIENCFEDKIVLTRAACILRTCRILRQSIYPTPFPSVPACIPF